MNKPLSKKEINELPLGFTSSGELPNRKKRRVRLSKFYNNRKLTNGRISFMLANFVDKAGKWLIKRPYLPSF